MRHIERIAQLTADLAECKRDFFEADSLRAKLADVLELTVERQEKKMTDVEALREVGKVNHTCHICGAFISDHKCLSCGHEECEKCPNWVPELTKEELKQRIAQLTAERRDANLRAERTAEVNHQLIEERDLARKQATVLQAALDSTDSARNKFLDERDAALRECETLREMGITMSSQIGRYQVELSRLKAPVSDWINAAAFALDALDSIKRSMYKMPASQYQMMFLAMDKIQKLWTIELANRAKQEQP
jgi:DNA repair exonuclease SbcCD ATPase subunit